MRKLTLFLSMLLLAMFTLPATASTTMASTATVGASVLSEGEDEGDGDGDDEEEEPPYVEPAYTVYLNIADPQAVKITVGYELRNIPPRVVTDVTAGEPYALTVDPGDGFIKVEVNEGFAFTQFKNTDMGNDGDYLQYSYQTTPVMIRKMVAVGEQEGVVVDGHHFVITTVNTAAFTQYSLTVNVDNASKALLKIGASESIFSSNLRTIELHNGENTVTYTDMDLYLHVSGSDMYNPLQSVMFNDNKAINDGTGVYTVRLRGSKTDGGRLDVVTAPDVEEDKFAFTATFDDIDYVKFITRMPANKSFPVSEGENTFTFNPGDYFELWTTRQAQECTFNGEDGLINFTEQPATESTPAIYIYTFYPTNNGKLAVRFNDAGPKPKTFTLQIDDETQFDGLFYSDADEEEYEVELGDAVDGIYTVTIAADAQFYTFYTADNKTKAYSFTVDGTEVEFETFKKTGYYNFTPVDGSKVVALFNEPVVEPDPTVTINVDKAENVVVYKGNYAAASTIISMHDGENVIVLDKADEKINIAPAIGVIIDRVTDANDQELTPGSDKVYTFNVVDGLKLNVTTHRVDFGEVFGFIIENPNEVEFSCEMMTESERVLELEDPHYNNFYINSEYDGFVAFCFEPTPIAVYVNATPMESEEGIYMFYPQAGDIVRVYFGDEQPAVYNVEFNIDESVAGKFAVMRDLLQEVDHNAAFNSELHGTYYVIYPAEEGKIKVTLSAKSGDVTPSAVGEEETEIPFEDGAFLVRVENDMRVNIKDATTSSVDAVIANENNDNEPIYNLNGVKLPAREIKSLPAGVYIIGGNKVMKR